MRIYTPKYTKWWGLFILMLWVSYAALANRDLINSVVTVSSDLTSHVTSTPPSGTVITWHSGSPATDANKVADPTAVGPGTYFAAYYDATNLCYSPASAPVQIAGGNIQASNVCPATTVNLTTHSTGTPPSGTTVTWHTGTPATSANKVADPTMAGSGTYYAAYFDATNNCYSPTSTPVQVTINSCGTVQASNVCPATTVNLTTHSTGTPPSGTTVTWHTGTPATSANKVADPTMAGAGTYYAAYFDATNSCYSPTSTPVQVTINSCSSIQVSNVCPATTVNLTTHSTGTPPSGTTVTWHTGTPATSANKVADPTMAGAGTYYAAYFDATNSCYSPTSTPVQVTINSCSSIQVSNVCPATTVNLTTHSTGTPPAGTTVTWHTGTPATTANKVADPTMVGSGTYYAAYFDATNSCYSPTSTPVQVTITTCTTPTNPPLVVIPPMVTEPDKPVTVCGTINDPDIGDTHTVTICSAPTKGTLATPTVNNTTHKVCLTYTPSTGQTGSDQVCLIVCDQTGKCDTVTVPIVITPTVPPSVTPQPPVVVVTGIITPQDSTTTTCMPILDPNGTGTNTYTICGAPKNGTANPITTAGGLLCVTYKPNAGYVGKDSLCLIVCDAGNLCDTILIPITVYPKVIPGTPQPPVVILPPIVTEPGNPVTICGLVNDPNVGDTHTATLCNTPSKGTISGMAINNLTHQLCLTYTPQSGQTGNDEVCVTVCDQTGKCTTVEVPVTIVPANGKPIATGDIAVTPQDKPVTGNVLTNDTDPEGGPLTVSTTPVTPPTKGTVTLNPDGTFTYTPTPGKTGEDVFCYQVSDAQGLKDTACVTVEIVPNPIAGNDAPIAADDNTQTPKNQPVVIAVKANDTDPDGNVLGSPTKISNPTNGTATVNPDGSITYTPNTGFVGTDTFKYSICDTGVPSQCDTATVTVNVVLPVAGNQAPVAVDDAKLTTVNTPVSGTVATNDSDPDNNIPLTFSKVTNPVNGTVTVNSDGTYTYTPNTGYIGNDRFTYKVCDSGTPSKCDTATVSIGILPAVNQAPIATGDIAVTPQDKPVTGNVLTNDTDPEGGPLTVSTTPVTPPTKGTVTLNPDGTFTYTPTPGKTGEDVFCYQVSDAQGLKDTACVTVEIVPNPIAGNDAPIAADDNTQTPKDQPVVIAVKANDTDPDGNVLGSPTKISNPTNGTATVNADGTITYTPNTGFVGTDTFKYSVCDNGVPSKCDTATVTINVVLPVAGNQAPVAVDDAKLTTVNTPVSGTVAANDSDPDNNTPLTYAKVTNPVNGTVTVNSDGTYTYTPNAGFIGNDRFTYKVCDSGTPSKCDTATVSIGILPATPQAPIAAGDIAVTPQDKPVTGNVLTNDKDPEGGPLTVSTTPVTPPTKGTLTLNSDGTFTYTPTPGKTGEDVFCYQVTDAQGLKDTACVTVEIVPTPIAGNDAPVAADDNTQTPKDQPVVIAVKANDSDPDGNTLGSPTKISNPTNGTATVNADGTITYTPNTGFVGTDTFRYSICDNGVPSKCDTATVTINVVLPVADNQAPVAVDDAKLTTVNTPVSGTVAANDSDPDNNTPLTYAKVTNPVNGTVTVNSDGTYTYTPNTGYIGNDRFTYKVCDSGTPSKCDTATVSIGILPAVNQAPIATGDIAVTPQDKPVTGNVLTNDTDPEGGPLTVSTTPVTPPTKGTVTLNPDGTFTYTPTPGKTGEDVFCYQVSDAQGLKDTACVTVEIVPNPIAGNDAPIAADDNTQTPKDQPVVIAVKANDTDPDGNVLGSPTKISNPTNGTATVNPDGSITYTPNTGFVGTDTFKYSICDTGVPSQCDTATVTVNVVLPVAGNQAPVAVDDAKLTTVNTPVSGTVAANDSDPDNNTPLTYAKVTNPVNGTVTVNSDGTYTYTPNTGYIGNDRFTYKVCDSGTPSKCDTATVSIGILPAAKVCLQAKVYLQGALFGVFLPDSLMRDDLRVQGFLPTTSPYPAIGMSGITNTNTTTAAVVGAGSPSGRDAIVDWVFVELRSAADPTVIVDSRSALLQRDGDIVDVDGVSSITFNSATPSSYYVSVKHRNHLGVMTKTAIDLTQGCTVIDFRKPSTPTYNLDATNVVNKAQVDVVQGVAMWGGNALYSNVADSKHEVIYQGTDNDVNVIYQQVINASANVFVLPSYKLKGYYTGDINLNGEVIFQGTGNDVEFIYQNVIKNHPGNTLIVPFFKIREQLP